MRRAGRGSVGWLGPRNVKFKGQGEYLHWQPSKAGSRYVEIPMEEELMIELAGVPEDSPALLLTEHGKPFASAKSLGNKVRKWVEQAGLVDLAQFVNVSACSPEERDTGMPDRIAEAKAALEALVDGLIEAQEILTWERGNAKSGRQTNKAAYRVAEAVAEVYVIGTGQKPTAGHH